MKNTTKPSKRLMNSKDQEWAKQQLKAFYDVKMIPAEKKSYLAHLRSSAGPYLGIESHDGGKSFMLDSSCQIATIGTGFNAQANFGVIHHEEAWNNDVTGERFQQLREAYVQFLKRMLAWPEAHVTLRNSGAEANETALGMCYLKRENLGANKVLAFEGSFHGRMQVSLAATWNPSKRTPFEWPGKEAVYLPYPEVKSDVISTSIPDGWREFWDKATGPNIIVPENFLQHPEMALETNCLMSVREKLRDKSIFAIIIEPMQCEGGDRYATSRFFTGLLILAKSFSVPVIFDEVQTGFHLGKSFFWHSAFDLRDSSGKNLQPDFVVCAKKAQVGIVISPNPIEYSGMEEINTASMIRGMNQGIILDQWRERIAQIEMKTRKHCQLLVNKWQEYMANIRVNGLAFAIDLKDASFLNKFIDLRFKYGQLFYPAGDYTLRFRLSVSFEEKDIEMVFEGLEQICQELFAQKVLPEKDIDISSRMDLFNQVEDLYAWHELLLEAQMLNWSGATDYSIVWQKAKKLMPSELDIVEINAGNIKDHLEAIEQLQKAIYEPARQTHRKLFELVAEAKNGVGLIVMKDKVIWGISFAGPSKLFPMERGIRRDIDFSNDQQLYFIDTTINKHAQHEGLGRKLKYLSYIMAMQKGASSLLGRNRDLLAGPMLNINLGLGCVISDFTKEDYLDEERARDAIFYKINLKSSTSMNLTNGLTSPLRRPYNIPALKERLLPLLVNKICLSNFVDKEFLEDIRTVMNEAPQLLRHGYSTSGQSECVDKIIKSMWFQGRKQQTLLTFNEHYFGNGSFLARALSNIWGCDYFNVARLDCPTAQNEGQVLQKLETELKSGHIQSIWIEPLRQRDFGQTPESFLRMMLNLAERYQTPVVFNETASSQFRYQKESFFASSEKLCPAAIMLYMGGQAGLAMVKPEYYVDKPLMLISTWDGDLASTAIFAHATRESKKRHGELIELRRIFQEVLKEMLESSGASDIKINGSTGSFQGPVPHSLHKFFAKEGNRYLVCANWESMLDFLTFARTQKD